MEVKESLPTAVWPENREVFEVFCGSATQWRTGGMDGHPTGLDYPAVRLVARAYRVAWTAAFFGDLQVMESAALKVWAAKRRRAGSQPPASAPASAQRKGGKL